MEVEMKDSGIPWVGKIPKNWEISKLKFCTDIIMGQSPNSDDISDEGKILFMQGNAEFEAKYPKPKHYCDKATKHSRMGDILMSVRAPVGALNFSNSIYGIGRGLCSIKPIKIETDYLWYFLQKSKSDFDFFSNGSTFDAITITVLKNFNIAIPPSQIQQQIANFLDDKCADIDQLITLQQQMIDELKAYKQSVITEAVCKGLDKSVPMKDSGIEWIGEVPEGWKILPISKIGKVSSSKRVFEEEYTDKGIPFFRSKEVSELSGGLDTSTEIFISEQTYSRVTKISSAPKIGDMLLTSIGTIGKTWIADGRKFYYKDGNLTQISSEEWNNTKYIQYCFKSNIIIEQYNRLSVGSTLLALTMVKIKNMILTYPPLEEQSIIVKYLDKKCSQIDTLISIKQQKIEELKEYKKSMIYEYITGKKQVPNN